MHMYTCMIHYWTRYWRLVRSIFMLRARLIDSKKKSVRTKNNRNFRPEKSEGKGEWDREEKSKNKNKLSNGKLVNFEQWRGCTKYHCARCPRMITIVSPRASYFKFCFFLVSFVLSQSLVVFFSIPSIQCSVCVRLFEQVNKHNRNTLSTWELLLHSLRWPTITTATIAAE